MSVRPLCKAPHETLRTPAKPVKAFDASLRRLARDMIETMYDSDGIGLAAPQVGVSVQLFVANPSQQPGQELVIANPILRPRGGQARMVEGCLSVPDIWGRVTRSARVEVAGQDLAGEPVTLTADGLLAIVLQHEVDHLHGTLFIDRLNWLRRQRLPTALRPRRCR